MKLILRIFLSGFVILILAIIINVVASLIGLTTWFSFLSNIKLGFIVALGQAKIINALFLFILYPALLGAAAYYSFKILLLIK